MESTQGVPAAGPELGEAQEKSELRREITDFVKLVAWFLVIFLGLRAFVIEGYEVQGESMDPTLVNNERILVFKLPHKLSQLGLFSNIKAIEADDIVVFDSPDGSGKRYVKRVIAAGPKAKGGRTANAASTTTVDPSAQVLVTYDNGDVFVNNRKIDQSYLTEHARTTVEHQDVTLGPGEYYVLGDNRPVSKDSRSFEAIEDEAIIGTAVVRFWPPSRISLIR
jgi:signal peptidase I